ncbi:MAG: sugar phosphate isomerase/epimerase [bacterium]|nr:sugar phosphate isomerase/epimerase [bacterium]
MLLDTFHMNIEEKDLFKTGSLFGSRVGHSHIADSNRLYPGAGHLDFIKIMKAIKKTGYKGYLSGEYQPLPDAQTAMKKYINYMRGV